MIRDLPSLSSCLSLPEVPENLLEWIGRSKTFYLGNDTLKGQLKEHRVKTHTLMETLIGDSYKKCLDHILPQNKNKIQEIKYIFGLFIVFALLSLHILPQILITAMEYVCMYVCIYATAF